MTHDDALPARLTDDEIADAFNGVDFAKMVTADDLFYLIARAVEQRVLAALAARAGEPVAIKNADGITLRHGWDGLPAGTPLFAAPPAPLQERCPRPCNGRPDDWRAADCIAAGECGCGAAMPAQAPAAVQACRPEDRAMLATPAGAELVSAVAAALEREPLDLPRLRRRATELARAETDWITAQVAGVSAGALRRAEVAVDDARDEWRDAVTPDVLLALIDEVERLRATVARQSEAMHRQAATIERQSETCRIDTEQVGRLLALLRRIRSAPLAPASSWWREIDAELVGRPCRHPTDTAP